MELSLHKKGKSMNGDRFLLAFYITGAAIFPCHQLAIAQTHQVGPSITELFEASRSFSGGEAQVIHMEKQQASLALSPGTTINFHGGDCLTLLGGKILVCTGGRTLELKAKDIYFELLNDSLAIFEIDEKGWLEASVLRGPGAVLSLLPGNAAGTDSSKKFFQVKEGQSYRFTYKQGGSTESQQSGKSIRYTDDTFEIIEESVPASWTEGALVSQLKKSNTAGKQMKTILKPAR